PQTEPENLPPSEPISKTEPSETRKDLESLRKIQNGENLTQRERQVVSLIKGTFHQILVWKTKEAFLMDWQKLTPAQVRLAELVLKQHPKQEKFFSKFLPKLGITPTELGLSDPTPKPTEPDGDQISLFD
ncbi:hypothetical protein, partial [Planktothrix sp.]